MSGNSKIEWTDRTWNPVTGCNKVSQGCKHCYAEGVADRFFAKQYPPNPDGSPRKFTDVRCHQDRLDYPLYWRKPARVFVNSMSDLFHETVPDKFIDRVFAVMALCPKHTFQILTKRPERMKQYLSSGRPALILDAGSLSAPDVGVYELGARVRIANQLQSMTPVDKWDKGCVPWPLPNVWLGVSVEDQPTADERIPILLQAPAAVRFISAEPLLGPINLEELPSHSGIGRYLDALSNAGVDPGAEVAAKLDWVICGGESGPQARLMNPEWARSMRDQCQAAQVPFFFKQWGAWKEAIRVHYGKELRLAYTPEEIKHAPKSPSAWIDLGEATFAMVGKHAAGRQLDGREWNEYPERAA